MPKISIVVPVYNSEKYLEQCIDSILRQTLKDFELILVDDGSTDNSNKIIEGYKNIDSRVKIIKQHNQYAGVARNNGLKIATGKYVIFLDSDDFFEDNMLMLLFNCAEKNKTDVVVFDCTDYDDFAQKDSVNKEDNLIHLPKKPFTYVDLGTNIFTSIPGVLWNKLLLRSFVIKTGLQYQAIKCCNDEFFNQMVLLSASSIVTLRKKLVHYRVNNVGSSQGTMRSELDYGIIYKLCYLKALKDELISRKMLKGLVRDSYIRFTQRRLCNWLLLEYISKECYDNVFNSIKNELVPHLFDDPEDFKDCSTINNLYKANSYEDFLFKQYQNQIKEKKNYISKSSKDYLVGHALLSIPRKIKSILKH